MGHLGYVLTAIVNIVQKLHTLYKTRLVLVVMRPNVLYFIF